MDGIVYGILTVFIFIGLVSTACFILLRLLHPKNAGKYVLLITAGANAEDIEGLLCAAKMRITLMGDCCRGRVIAVDCGLKTRERLLCEDLCRGCGDICLCYPEDLPGLVREDGCEG